MADESEKMEPTTKAEERKKEETNKGTDTVQSKPENIEPSPSGEVKEIQKKNPKKDVGMAQIKSEFIDYNHKRVLAVDCLPKATIQELQKITYDNNGEKDKEGDGDADTSEPPKKKPKLRGRNKRRFEKTPREGKSKLCAKIVAGETCPYGDSCRYEHNVESYLAQKPKNVGDRCYAFEQYGKCPFGVTCMYSGAHIGENFENMVNKDLFKATENREKVSNTLQKDVQRKLWKKQYDFTKTDKIVRDVKNGKVDTDCVKKLRDVNIAKQPHVSGSNGSTQNATLFGKLDSIISKKKSCAKSTASDANKQSGQSEKPGLSLDSIASDSIAAAAQPDICQSELDQDLQSILSDKKVSDKSENTEKAVAGDNTADNTSDNSDNVQKAENDSASMETDIKSEEVSESISEVSAERSTGADKASSATVKSSGCVTDEDIVPLRLAETKKINFRDKLYLAPLTTVGNLPYRKVCKHLGADITCSEMATCVGLLQGKQSEWALLKRDPCEDLFGVQVCGAYADQVGRCAQLLTDNVSFDYMDLNCGCPIDLFYKRGEGCALMNRTNKFFEIVQSTLQILKVPMTVKMRTGVFEDKYTAHKIIPKLRDWGVSLVTLHGRSREQRYTRLADWNYIDECAKIAAPMPLFGNGDILSYEDYVQHREHTGVAGCMLARGALMKPWLFTEIKEQRHWDISASERLDILKDYTNYGLDHWGSDQQGVASTRKFLLEWLSFLYRYIPVGVLERVPQKINEKPPFYFGRNDLETLMASGNCADWVKISEMLLGPVPDGFTFVPKHKANAYS